MSLPETVVTNTYSLVKLGTDTQTGPEYKTGSDHPVILGIKRNAPAFGKKGVTRTLLSLSSPGEDILLAAMSNSKRITVNITVAHPEDVSLDSIVDAVATAAGLLSGTTTAVTLADFAVKAIGGHR